MKRKGGKQHLIHYNCALFHVISSEKVSRTTESKPLASINQESKSKVTQDSVKPEKNVVKKSKFKQLDITLTGKNGLPQLSHLYIP